MLNDNNTPLDKIMSIVENKKKIADEFYKLSGIQWKL